MRDVLTQEMLKEIFLGILPAVDMRHEISYRLKSAIESGLLNPGCRIKQQAIADICNVSRMPVREALRMLGVQGYLENQTHKGYVVASVLPSQSTMSSLKQLISPLKAMYDMLDSPEAQAQFELNVIQHLRNSE
jgi:DNA-binding FadR family transcriptional regulator